MCLRNRILIDLTQTSKFNILKNLIKKKNENFQNFYQLVL